MFSDLQRDAGGVDVWNHNRAPAAIDRQTVIRLNRDTLYSFAIVDISDGATFTIPDAGVRYLSVMVVNQDHYINRLFHEPGDHAIGVDEFDTPWVMLAARILVDPARPGRVQREQHHRHPERRRLDHRSLRRMRRRPSELHSDHGRVELRRPPIPTEARGRERCVDVPRRSLTEREAQPRAPGERAGRPSRR